MHTLRLSADRGHADHGWLNARHSFSFANYYDSNWMGFSNLRVINEDIVAPGTGFASHGHKDMEIITYPLSGAVQHKDSTGGNGVVSAGEVQVMHAGRGIRHSEANASHSQPLHLLQIWIQPEQSGVQPGYEQAPLSRSELLQGFERIVARAGSSNAAPFYIHADAELWLAWPQAGQQLRTALAPQRRYYLHIAKGTVQAQHFNLTAGDALMIEAEAELQITASTDAELLLFNLP